MHYIQKSIMGLLSKRASARYSELKPSGVESNLFAYHLRLLMREGYVAKAPAGGYILQPKGKLYADQLGQDGLAPRMQAKIIVLLAIRDSRGQYILYRRNRQPFIGLMGFPYAKINLGERIADAADRQLRDDMQLECALRHSGDGYITSYEDGALVSEVFFHLFTGESLAESLAESLQYGDCSWQDVASLAPSELLPGVMDIYAKLAAGAPPFFIEVQKYV